MDVGFLRRDTQGIHRGWFGQQLDDLAELFFVDRADLDFIHALSYVFAAAMADRKFAAGRPNYQEWIRRVWRGE